MDIDEIIKKNKEKRNQYVSGKNNNEDLTPKLKYIKGLISRTLITIIFVLASIIFTNVNAKNKEWYQKYVLENSLSFTKINNLYQSLFGNVDFLKKKSSSTTSVFENVLHYSNIEEYQNGVKLTVGMNTTINVITSGLVVFIGEKENLGNTIIIQGNDGADIWYSNITDTNIKIYDYVEAGSILGVSNTEDIYLTIEKNGEYVNYEDYENSL